MKALRLVIILAAIVTITGKAYAAPVDHVYVSSNKLDKLNLDGSLDMQFLPGSTDGICRQLAVDGNTGNVWLACESEIAGNNRVYLFDSNGNILHQCSDTPQFCSVVTLQGGMCIDPSGNAWITDRVNNQVYKYTTNGTRSGPYSVGGACPTAIACDGLGNVWTTNNCSPYNVSKLGNDGSLIAIYLYGSNIAIAVDQNNNILVTEGNGIRRLDNNGNNLGYYPINLPTKIAIDQIGNIWVSSAVNNSISKLSSIGANLGNYPLSSPYYIAIDGGGNIWVVLGNNTITKLTNNGVDLGNFPLSGGNGMNDTGFLHKRFVLGYNSVDGPNVWVPINGGAPAGAVTLNFDYIATKGNSSYTESSTGTAAPSGFKLGTPPRYYDITSTATYTDNIEVCIGYNETEFSNEANIRLFHNESGWVNITTSLDTTNNMICGDVTSLSEFAIMEPTGEGPIPTVSEWMLVLMGAILFVAIVRRVKLSQKIA